MFRKSLISWLLLLLTTPAPAEEGFRPLFNGKDLQGWVNVNCAPSTFKVRDNMIVCSGVPTGVMRTARHYENFILELEWRHMKPKGNAGLFVWSDPVTSRGVPFTRSIEVQILDGRNTRTYTSHGDVFSIHGARLKPDRPHPTGAMRCLPSERRCKPAGQWNHYRVICRDGVIKLAVNGKVVSGASLCTPRKGYICLESEGSEVHFRNIKIKTLPSSNPPPGHVAGKAVGFVSLYDGLSFDGWQYPAGHQKHWQSKDWRLTYDGKSTAANKSLTSKKTYKDFELIVDCLPRGAQLNQIPIFLRGTVTPAAKVAIAAKRWSRLRATVRGDRVTLLVNGKRVFAGPVKGMPRVGTVGLKHLSRPVDFANIYVRELR